MVSFTRLSPIFTFLAVACLALLSSAVAEEPKFTPQQLEFFQKQVKPILAAKCFKCHGGEADVEGDFWLTSRAGLLRGGESGPVVDFKSHDESPLLLAINYEELEMPPKEKLSDEQIDVLTRWVKMDAPWTPGDGPTLEQIVALAKFSPTAKQRAWWAYQPLTKPEPPKVKNSAWVTNPIDAFLLAKLEAAGLTPAAEADRAKLVRRVYYDLIGLPPTPQQIKAFVDDKSPDAYTRLIEQLLESPHYGEKWGRHWLDLVRYAETNGYERDSAKPHVWRYRDYVIKSFNDDKPYNQFLLEQLAGDELDEVTPETLAATGFYRLGIWDDEPADRLLAKYDYLDGVVSTTSQVMMGMMVGCARCHTHKVDPIPHEDYYRLLAFFENISWSMRDRAVRKMQVNATPPPEIQEKIAKLKQVTSAYERDLVAALQKADLATPGNAEGKKILVADSRAKGQSWRYTTSKPADDWAGPGFGDGEWKEGNGGFGTNGTPGSVVHTTWNSSDIWLRKKFRLTEIPDSLVLNLHHDEDVEVFLNGVQILKLTGYITKYETVKLDQRARDAAQTGQNVLAVHCHQTGGGQYVDVGLDAGALTLAGAAQRHGKELLGEERTQAFLDSFRQLQTIVASRPAESGQVEILCIAESGNQPTHVLKRGNPHVQGEQVTPGYPKILDPIEPEMPTTRTPSGSSGRRLALARWLSADDNRMTSRVMANRVWQYHFGRGIVPTPNDFGGLGRLPTHPQLLDYLASELVAGDWSIKSLHRLIMHSSAYRMASTDDAAGLAEDPANNLFWRFDMRRLTAEEVRDSILAVNGTLNLKVGGASVYTKVPKAILHTSSTPGSVWGRSSPEDQVRRSVYVFVKRSLVEPFLGTFDAADTDNSCAVRFATTVPTQALTMLNSDFMQEQAAVFADRLRREAGKGAEAQVRLGLQLALGREPTTAEVQENVELISTLQQEDEISAEQALNHFCLLVLNLNEFIYVD